MDTLTILLIVAALVIGGFAFFWSAMKKQACKQCWVHGFPPKSTWP